MKYLNQAVDSRTCGQTTLAIFLEKSTEEICEIMGKTGGTRTSDVLRVLDHFNIKVGSRKLTLLSKKNPLPERAIFHIRPAIKIKSFWGHWSLVYDGYVYDPRPMFTGPSPTDVYLANMPNMGEKITSFLELM